MSLKPEDCVEGACKPSLSKKWCQSQACSHHLETGDPEHRHRFLKRFNISGGSKDPEAFNLTTLDKPRQSNGCSAAAALCLRRQPEANDGGSRTKVRLRREEVMGLTSAWFMEYCAS